MCNSVGVYGRSKSLRKPFFITKVLPLPFITHLPTDQMCHVCELGFCLCYKRAVVFPCTKMRREDEGDERRV